MTSEFEKIQQGIFELIVECDHDPNAIVCTSVATAWGAKARIARILLADNGWQMSKRYNFGIWTRHPGKITGHWCYSEREGWELIKIGA